MHTRYKTPLPLLGALFILSLTSCEDLKPNKSQYNNDRNVILYKLLNEKNEGQADISYICDSMRKWQRTTDEGVFGVQGSESCTFELTGYTGVHQKQDDDVIYIVNSKNEAMGDIPYECESYGDYTTYEDGSFGYDEEDRCLFRF